MAETGTWDGQSWDDHYSGSDEVWSGNPNPALVREAGDLAPGHALDIGCGEGADAVWLARRGWRVTAVDVSGVALERAAGKAAQAEVTDRIEWRRCDLAEDFPQGSFDLISAQFLHSRGDLPRERILRAAAAAVAPGGTLLVVGHAEHPAWAEHQQEHHEHPHFPTPQEVLDGLELPEGQWEVLRREEVVEDTTDPDGRPAARKDNVVRVRRRAA